MIVLLDHPAGVHCLAVLHAGSDLVLFLDHSRRSGPAGSLGNERQDLIFQVFNLVSDIARSVVLVIVGWIENQLVNVQREQHTQLLEANKKLRKYALTNEKLAQTQERNRLARELHDTLAHTLSSVSVQLEATKALFDRDPNGAKEDAG